VGERGGAPPFEDTAPGEEPRGNARVSLPGCKNCLDASVYVIYEYLYVIYEYLYAIYEYENTCMNAYIYLDGGEEAGVPRELAEQHDLRDQKCCSGNARLRPCLSIYGIYETVKASTPRTVYLDRRKESGVARALPEQHALADPHPVLRERAPGSESGRDQFFSSDIDLLAPFPHPA